MSSYGYIGDSVHLYNANVMQQEQLIKQAQQGDKQAFEQLLNEHYDSLFSFAYKWCGNQTDAEDITQQACIKLARSISQFQFKSAFSSWLYRLVINCAKDWYKSQNRHTRNTQDVDTAQISSAQQTEQALYTQQLLSLLDDLPKGMKETALLVHAEGLSHKEAASILDIKESTVSWRIHEIRKNLQQQLSSATIGLEGE